MRPSQVFLGHEHQASSKATSPSSRCSQTHQDMGAVGWLPFHSSDRDIPTCGSKPQTFRAECLTPMPQSALQRLLHFPFPPRASCLSRGIPGPRRRAVICQPEVGKKRNSVPKIQEAWCEYPDPANPRARLEPAACKQQPRVSLSNRARSSPWLAGRKKGLFLSVKDSSLG